jgi:hypothetical protein
MVSLPDDDITGTTHGMRVLRAWRSSSSVGVAYARCEVELLRRHFANRHAVHGEERRFLRRDHRDAITLEVAQAFRANGFDLGDDHVGPVLVDDAAQLTGVQHVDHFEGVGDLHRGGTGVAVDGYHRLAEALGGDDDFLPQLAGAE